LIQPLQFQLKVAKGIAVPLQVSTVVALVVEGSTQIELKEGLKTLVGVLFTVTNTLVTGEVQAGALGFTTCKVTVFVPVVFQDKV
jgi:hypothetical protein